MTLTPEFTGTKTDSPTGAQYDSAARLILVTICGQTFAVTVGEFATFLESGCRAFDCRTTAHPFDYAEAADHIRHARTADAQVA